MSSSRFTWQSTPLAGLLLASRAPRSDARGFLCRIYCNDEFSERGLQVPVVQINHTLTRERGTIRGMHFQRPPHAEVKFVSCLRGEIFDVAVDLRRDSPTYLQWHGERLSAENFKSLLIPKGFAHGFQTLTHDCELLYLHSERYVPAAEGALHPLDPKLSIDWPIETIHLSDRDRSHAFIDERAEGVLF